MTGNDAISRWRRLRDRYGCPTPFAHEDVVHGIARAAGLRVEPVFCEEGGHEAGALLYVRRRGPLAQVVIPPFCFYSAVILPADAPDGIRDRLILRLLDLVLGLSPDANVVLPPGTPAPGDDRLPEPWRRSEFRTYRSSVEPIEDAIGQWSSSTRWRYRKHVDSFTVERGVKVIPAILEHVSAAYDRHGRGLPIPRPRLEALVTDLAGKGHVDVVGLREPGPGDLVAGIVLMVDDTTGWDWIAGSIRGPGMTVCIGRALERLSERGVRTFDFGGANIPAIATFKRQFGGDEATYVTLETPTRPAVRFLSVLKRRVAGGG